MRTFGTLVLGMILGVAAIALGVYCYFATGRAPVGTAEPPLPFEKKLAHRALNARVDREMPKTVPLQPDEPNLAAGGQLYREHCAVCHGLPGQTETPIAKGMYPRPPKLMEGKGVTDDEPGESYWKVANGIRLTGMPGFRPTLSETQMWQVSLLVANADKLPKSVHDALSAPLSPDVAAKVVPAK
ncbi:MAG TPA: cytochrome c [Candidatus Dormibacteraeota bacterium]|jgi:thiosulfate dehydrogenase|nr:cytochrome c [Candidatus Dormibacteraeota bacterium]